MSWISNAYFCAVRYDSVENRSTFGSHTNIMNCLSYAVINGQFFFGYISNCTNEASNMIEICKSQEI